jgi:hypothetical protein
MNVHSYRAALLGCFSSVNNFQFDSTSTTTTTTPHTTNNNNIVYLFVCCGCWLLFVVVLTGSQRGITNVTNQRHTNFGLSQWLTTCLPFVLVVGLAF